MGSAKDCEYATRNVQNMDMVVLVRAFNKATLTWSL
jgi:hypothetical protein